MKEAPFVSVIITNHNFGRFVCDALHSVTNQTYENLELIVVDDGSTDDSVEIIEAFCKQSRVSTEMIRQKQAGQAAAFNTGFKIARGKFIAFLDSDDLWMSKKLDTVIEAFADERLVLVQHSLQMFRKRPDEVGQVKHFPGKLPHTVVLSDYFNMQTSALFSATSGLTFRKSALDKIYPFEEGWNICADVCLTRPIPLFGNVLTLERSLGYYRVHGANHWMNSPSQAKIWTNFKINRDYTNRCLKRFGEPRRIKRGLVGFFFHRILWHMQQKFLTQS